MRSNWAGPAYPPTAVAAATRTGTAGLRARQFALTREETPQNELGGGGDQRRAAGQSLLLDPADEENGLIDHTRPGGLAMRKLLLAALVVAASVPQPDAVGESIDEVDLPLDQRQPLDDADFNDLLEPVASVTRGGQARRLYLAGIIGDSFATLGTPLGPDGNGTGDPSPSPAANQSLFTAGGAIGLAFEALDREWRVEFEGRGRNDLVSNRTSTFDSVVGPETFLFTTTAKNGWSTMVNLWRDYELTDRWTMYIGGGIGAGGYRFSYRKFSPADNFQIDTSPYVNAFAWQAGGGTAYAITDRITLDIGYRFFQIANGTSTAAASYAPGPPVGSEVIASAFSASELFFAFRIYEPFRSWR